MLLNMEKFAWVSLSIMWVRAVLALSAGIGEKKFAYFLDNIILYLCNIRNEAVAKGALRPFIARPLVVKLTSFFFICCGYHFMTFFLVLLWFFDVFSTKVQILAFVSRIIEIVFWAHIGHFFPCDLEIKLLFKWPISRLRNIKLPFVVLNYIKILINENL